MFQHADDLALLVLALWLAGTVVAMVVVP